MSLTESLAEDLDSTAAVLECNAAKFGARTAIRGEGGMELSHRELYSMVAANVSVLNSCGIGRGDRVAIALPPGPDLAVAFLGVAAGACSAPLNPAYLEGEFKTHLQNLPAKALIVLRGVDSPSRRAAAALGIRVLELNPVEDGGGFFGLFGVASSAKRGPEFARPADVALVLHTSGTTSRPKRVPLTQANLCTSARNIASTLQLGPDDVSLSAMPLFHIHGLACLLAGLCTGGCCVCVGSFDADRFLDWMETWKPTWFSGVPTMLQAVLDSVRDLSFTASSLRFIRSSSAALPPPVAAGLERVFGVPVIESYGMTEAAHQMASNPLPPRKRKSGSVGLPAGPEVRILDQLGTILESGGVGEVAVMGPNVMRGYENNPEANASAFSSGWFRTGDQGYLDDEGYLFIAGRLKELINRGGEKVAPREIDEALLAHRVVRQAVTFAMPHSSLGEDIVAAVVLQNNASCTEAELRAFLLDRLAPFKVPSCIVFVDDLPKGPTGKVQRIGMADRLASIFTHTYEAPVSDMEKLVAATIGEVLGREAIGREDNFFLLGGDSLRATQVLVRLQQSLTLELPMPLLFRLPTSTLLAAYLEELVSFREIELLAASLAALPRERQTRLLDEAEFTTATPPDGNTGKS
jgi:oxalate---CoA ligase